MVAMVEREGDPDPPVTLRSARQGPRGKCELKGTVTDSDVPGDKTTPSCAANGPASRPPGPCDSLSEPVRSKVFPPELRTAATITSAPDDDRSALSAPRTKFDGALPPGPIAMYIRTPARLTNVIPCPPEGDDAIETHATAWYEPADALVGTFVVTVSNVSVCGPSPITLLLMEVQLESALAVVPGANTNAPRITRAAATYTDRSAKWSVSLSISTTRERVAPGARRSTMYELARGLPGCAPRIGTRRMPTVPGLEFAKVGEGEAATNDCGRTATIPVANSTATSTFQLMAPRSDQATDCVMVAV